jgi:hypothetical protein
MTHSRHWCDQTHEGLGGGHYKGHVHMLMFVDMPADEIAKQLPAKKMRVTH